LWKERAKWIYPCYGSIPNSLRCWHPRVAVLCTKKTSNRDFCTYESWKWQGCSITAGTWVVGPNGAKGTTRQSKRRAHITTRVYITSTTDIIFFYFYTQSNIYQLIIIEMFDVEHKTGWNWWWTICRWGKLCFWRRMLWWGSLHYNCTKD
jgi:hypothetical protein